MKEKLQIAVEYLRSSDKVLRQIIDTAGPCNITFRRDRFSTLVGSIVGQQLSAAAARTIRQRLVDHVGILTPVTLLELSEDTYRGFGISLQKARYILDLSHQVHTGSLPINQLGRLSDEAVIEKLVAVKGIGRWTAQMFLIFSLGRLDVLPHDDQGVRNAIRLAYGLSTHPTKEEMDTIAEPWRPYASVACWYCWEFLDRKLYQPSV